MMQHSDTARAVHTFDSSEDSASYARRLTADFLQLASGKHAVRISERAVDLSQLVVSELVTNACKYAPGPIALELTLHGPAIEIAVWDSNPAAPTIQATDPSRVGQHGLEIVIALAQSFEVRSETVGKRIAACIALTDHPHINGARRIRL
ncbi:MULTISPECIES: ATP-binding protein [unclassified Streptomyces]|uniref:ATP-binding protein n=1 Tax=unclassified Streptomyces TaxID=2593676 RepID=UPI0035D8EFCD